MKKNLIPIAALQEKISALTSAQKALLLIATVLVLGAGFYFFQYQDQAESIRRLQRNINEQNTRLTALKQAAARVEVLQKELAEAEDEFTHLLALLPDQKEIPVLLENISELGAQVGLENVLFQPQPEQKQDFYATIPVQLALLGTYRELGTFFDGISKLNRILKVENLNVARQKGVPELQVGCTIVTYRFLEKSEQPAATPKKK